MKLTLMGAGGKMGCRIADNLIKHDDFDVRYVEVSPAGIARLAERGIVPTARDDALAHAEAVILAVPDALLGKITHEIVPALKPGTVVMTLDPAAAYAGSIVIRDDLVYFIAHPCHPPLYNDETDDGARVDWFGGVRAKQHIVCALHHGPESTYPNGEAIARAIYAPVMNAFRVTTEQMAVLEPALVETLLGSCLRVLREGLDETVKMGVPREAAWEFFSGHMRTILASVFDVSGLPLSDGANMAIANALPRIFRDDWKQNVFDVEEIRKSVNAIAHTS